MKWVRGALQQIIVEGDDVYVRHELIPMPFSRLMIGNTVLCFAEDSFTIVETTPEPNPKASETLGECLALRRNAKSAFLRQVEADRVDFTQMTAEQTAEYAADFLIRVVTKEIGEAFSELKK